MRKPFVSIAEYINFIRNGIYKIFIGPLIYGREGSYDAERYWEERLKKHGMSMAGVGVESFSEKRNLLMYQESARSIKEVLFRENIGFDSVCVLEVGCGNGFYTGILRDLGVKNYTGIDITDTLFPKLCGIFPGYEFIKKDVSKDAVQGKYDLIVMIDVLEHIVTDAGYDNAANNLKGCINNNGIIVLGPIMDNSRKRLFYLRDWSVEDTKYRFEGYTLEEIKPFRYGTLVVIRKKKD